MAIQRKGDDLETRGMKLDIDRNTRTSKGEYIISKVTYDKKEDPIIMIKVSNKNER